MDAEARAVERRADTETRLEQLRALWDKRRRGEPFVRLGHLPLVPGDVLLVRETESPWMAEDWLGVVTAGDHGHGWYVLPVAEIQFQWRVNPSQDYLNGKHYIEPGFPEAKGVYLSRADTAIKL